MQHGSVKCEVMTNIINIPSIHILPNSSTPPARPHHKGTLLEEPREVVVLQVHRQDWRNPPIE